MAIIINDPYARGGGAEAGKQFGDLLSTGLQQLASNKAKNMERRANIAQLMPLVGGNSQLANLLAGNPKLQEIYFKEQFARGGHENYLNALEKASGQQQEENPKMSVQPEQVPSRQEDFALPEAPQRKAKPYWEQQEEPAYTKNDFLQNLQKGGLKPEEPLKEYIQGQLPKKKVAPVEPEVMQPKKERDITAKDLKGLKPHEAAEVLKAQAQRKADDRKILLAERKLKHKQEIDTKKFEHEQEKLERPYYEEIMKDYTTSRSTMQDLGRMTNLINKGEVVNPTEDHIQRWLSKTLKINLRDLRGADTEEFDKIVAGFIKNAKAWFGSRVTNFDLEKFMKTLPELSTSHEGKMRLIGSMKAAALAQQIRATAFQDLMKANNGRIPPYAKLKVEEMIAPQLDILADQFTSGELAPKLSPEAIKGAKRNSWMRWAKAFLTGAKQAGGAIHATTKAVGNVIGAAAGLPIQ